MITISPLDFIVSLLLLIMGIFSIGFALGEGYAEKEIRKPHGRSPDPKIP